MKRRILKQKGVKLLEGLQIPVNSGTSSWSIEHGVVVIRKFSHLLNRFQGEQRFADRLEELPATTNEERSIKRQILGQKSRLVAEQIVHESISRSQWNRQEYINDGGSEEDWNQCPLILQRMCAECYENVREDGWLCSECSN